MLGKILGIIFLIFIGIFALCSCKVASWADQEMENDLKEMEDMSYHNIGCYANKDEYKKQYATELYRIELLSQIKLDISKKYNVTMAIYYNQLELTDIEVKTILGKE